MAERAQTASLTPAYGVGPDGRLYKRGYRLHCAACGALGAVASHAVVGNQVTAHVCGPRP